MTTEKTTPKTTPQTRANRLRGLATYRNETEVPF